MDVEQAIRTQRAVRAFRAEPLSDADLHAILDAGRRSGSAKNLQRWDFVVVRQRQRLIDLSQVGAWAGHLSGAALAVALITPDPRGAAAPHSIMWDLGRAAQNMILAAWARGLGSAPATVYEQDLCRASLGYPPDRHCEYILSFGYPADPSVLARRPRPGGRRSLDEVVHDEHW